MGVINHNRGIFPESSEVDMEKDGLILMLDQLRRGVEFTGWTGGKEYQDYLFEIVDAFIDLHTKMTMVPRIEGFIKREANEFVKDLGFAEMTDEEWKVFALKLFNYADWHEAMTRTFWEEILPLRVGKEAGINRLYTHTYEHCDCEWQVKWYVDHTCLCPICKAPLTPTKSVPAVD